jgi:hypothetical protein
MTQAPAPLPADPFQAAPPHDVHRSANRRMPEIEDFPTVGQREFQAKSGRYGGPPALPGAPQSRQPDPPESPARSGLLQRMMGNARKDDSSMREEGGSEASKSGRRLSGLFSRNKG